MAYYRILSGTSTAKAPARRGMNPATSGRPTRTIEVRWERPVGRYSGLIVREIKGKKVYQRRVGPADCLSMAEAAVALGTYRMQVYRLAQAGMLRTQEVWGVRGVPLSEVKRLMGRT